VLVKDQPFFNESLASYVADALTDNWIKDRFGPGSPEEVAWTMGQALHLPRVARLLAAYKALDAVYKSSRTRDQKLAEKARIIDELVADLEMRKRPNNASLTEVRVYNGGAAPLLVAHRVCGDLRSLVEAAKTLKRSDFKKPLEEDLTVAGQLLAARCKSVGKKLDH
jgi:predicted aminopeptidase